MHLHINTGMYLYGHITDYSLLFSWYFYSSLYYVAALIFILIYKTDSIANVYLVSTLQFIPQTDSTCTSTSVIHQTDSLINDYLVSTIHASDPPLLHFYLSKCQHCISQLKAAYNVCFKMTVLSSKWQQYSVAALQFSI